MTDRIWIGCVADDFTGASDAASYLRQAGLSVILYSGVPSHPIPAMACPQAVVIALKCRAEPADEAVEHVLGASRWLSAQGTETIYFKYCSTFDSTSKGNIGPVMDALLEEYHTPYSLICPTFLENGRSVRDGILYVGEALLENSSMRNHPLTPMTDSRLAVLMERQSSYRTHLLSAAMLKWDKIQMKEYVKTLQETEKRFYLVPDFYEMDHGVQLVRFFSMLPVLSGGSGLIQALAEYKAKESCITLELEEEKIPGTAIMLAGSCSKTTLAQIKDYERRGGITYAVHPVKLLAGEQTKEDVLRFMEVHSGQEVLIYTSVVPEELHYCKELWQKELPEKPLAAYLEHLLAELAVWAVENGTSKIICAGGETSGAITKALGFKEFYIGKSIAPGVPVLIPVDQNNMRLVLKSGNFGPENFFTVASDC